MSHPVRMRSDPRFERLAIAVLQMRGALMRIAALCWLGCVCLMSCASEDAQPGGVSIGDDHDAGGQDLCIDEDGDGFGRDCDRGRDCDDADPSITNECRVCATPKE